jgi:lysophospholipid acyltransferase (LPLAT)-like uncharacterized protein
MMLKRLLRSAKAQDYLGSAIGRYFQFVWQTGRLVTDSDEIYRAVEPHMPCIVATWHGQHFLACFPRRKGHDFRALISRSRDGAIQASAARRLGLGVIRGSGGSPDTIHRKRGDTALRQMIRALNDGASIALTADVPKVSRVVGAGIVALARASGRPIIPLAVVTKSGVTLKSWDRASVNFPFSRIACVAGEPIFVPKTREPGLLESLRLAVEKSLNEVNERALRMVAARRV